MSFYIRHQPKTLAELVFHDPKVASTINKYAKGERDKHLLLYGPPGSGKSAAVKFITESVSVDAGGSGFVEILDIDDLNNRGFDFLSNSWGMGKHSGATRLYAVIDEVDGLHPKTLRQMRTFVDKAHYLTFLCTTNYRLKLDGPLRDRFLELEVEHPTRDEWIPRAISIMHKEGKTVTEAKMKLLLTQPAYSARKLMDQLIEVI